ncbi:hypothetical protein AX16_000817 [Volvariella volvacea WC 439]|nr:hypothetical protein AX16_000817 [Volvariella volvacea WC 439]
MAFLVLKRPSLECSKDSKLGAGSKLFSPNPVPEISFVGFDALFSSTRGPSHSLSSCHQPRVFQKWSPNAILPGHHNEPVPVQYVFNWEKAHRLLVVDIDGRDAQFAIYVNYVLQAVASGFDHDDDHDEDFDCGEDTARCLALGFS